MTEKNVRSAYIVLNDLGDAAVREIHRILATFPGEYSVHVTEPDEENHTEDKYFPLYINVPSQDGPGTIVGRGRVIDVSDTANVELEIYDTQVIKKLREFDIAHISMQNVDLMRKEGVE